MSEASKTWSTRIALRCADFDYLGHMTATAYLGIVEEARVTWFMEGTVAAQPSYVVARQELVFRREILPGDGPLTVSIGATSITRDRFEVHEALSSASGHLHATSTATLVAWDREHRRPRPLSPDERAWVEACATVTSRGGEDGSAHE